MPGVSDLGALYSQAREQVSSLVRSLGPQQLETPVPSCPGWTVHDVVSHLAGVAHDVITGRLTGIPTPEETAAQVAARAGTPTSIVLREWERTGSQLEVLLGKAGRYADVPVIDATVHEQDIRGAVGLPGNRSGELIDLTLRRPFEVFVGKVESSGLPAVRVVDDAGVLLAGSDDAPVELRASRFELMRCVYGRRSATQIGRRFAGADNPGAYVDLLVVFGPAASDIVE